MTTGTAAYSATQMARFRAAEKALRPETPGEYAARMNDPWRQWFRAEAAEGTRLENLADPD